MQDLLFIVSCEKTQATSQETNERLNLIGKQATLKNYKTTKDNDKIFKGDSTDIVEGFNIVITEVYNTSRFIQAKLIITNRKTGEQIRNTIYYNKSTFIDLPGTKYALHCGIATFEGNSVNATNEENARNIAKLSELTGIPFKYKPHTNDSEPGND